MSWMVRNIPGTIAHRFTNHGRFLNLYKQQKSDFAEVCDSGSYCYLVPWHFSALLCGLPQDLRIGLLSRWLGMVFNHTSALHTLYVALQWHARGIHTHGFSFGAFGDFIGFHGFTVACSTCAHFPRRIVAVARGSVWWLILFGVVNKWVQKHEFWSGLKV